MMKPQIESRFSPPESQIDLDLASAEFWNDLLERFVIRCGLFQVRYQRSSIDPRAKDLTVKPEIRVQRV